MQGYVQDALRKKELIASFVDHFKKNHENTISVSFQFYIPKLSQERCFVLSLLYVQGALRKKQLIVFFIDHLNKIIKIRHISIFSFKILN